MSPGGGIACCSAYVAVRYHISKSFVITDFAKLCGLPGHGPSVLTVHHGHMCCHALLHGTAAGCYCPGVLPQVSYAVFARPLPSLSVLCLGCVGSACLWPHRTQAAAHYSLASRLYRSCNSRGQCDSSHIISSPLKS
jgi:hypothetical protein